MTKFLPLVFATLFLMGCATYYTDAAGNIYKETSDGELVLIE